MSFQDTIREARLARYFGIDSETQSGITRALVRVPAEVRQFAITECVFVSAGADTLGLCRPVSIIGQATWLIVLAEGEAEIVENVVAHEVAHAWLGHDIGDTSSTHEEIEAATRQLLRDWGFKGEGADEPAE